MRRPRRTRRTGVENDALREPAALFNVMRDLVRERLGEGWKAGSPSLEAFMALLAINAQTLDGVHLMGEPALEDGVIHLTLWIDYPVVELADFDEIAFELFGRVSPELLLSARSVDERTIVYRFLAGTVEYGHAGELELVGPFVAEFARLHGLRGDPRRRYDA